MQKAHHAASRGLALSNASDERPAQSFDRAADAWSLLAQMYGQRFVDDYGEEPPLAWVDAFARLTDEELANGFRNLEADGRAFPPTQPQFVAACRRRDSSPRYLGVPLTAEQQRHLLPAPHERAKPETRDRFLASVRAKLGMRA